MKVSPSNSLAHLLNEDAFCIKLAKHFFPSNFNVDECVRNTFYGPVLFKNRTADELVRCTIPEMRHIDFSFLVYSQFEKTYLLNKDNSIDKEIVMPPVQNAIVSGGFDIIGRKKIENTLPLFLKELVYYKANTLLAEEIEVDSLSLHEIKKVAEEHKYKVVLVGEIAG